MRFNKKTAVIAAAGLLAAAGLIYVLQTQGGGVPAAASAPPGAPAVPVAKVVMREIAPAAEFTGHLAAPDTVELRAQVSGPIIRVSVPEGGLVQRGQLLFQIDPRPFQVALDGAQAQLRQAEALLAQAQSDLSRAEQLAPGGAIPVRALENAQSKARQSEAQVAAARAAVAAARLDLSYTRVTAPISGRVDRVLVTTGNIVAAGTTPLTSIVSVNPVYAYFDMDEATYLDFAQRARPNGSGRAGRFPVQIGLMSEDGFPHQGTLDFLGAQVDRGTGTIRARAIVANPSGQLAPGLFARIRLDTGAPRQAMLIDDQAVGAEQGQTYVMVLGEGNTAEYRPVSLGPVVDGMRVVETGLNPGDTVIVKGLVRPGMKVTPQPMAAAPTAAATATGAAAPAEQAAPSAEAAR